MHRPLAYLLYMASCAAVAGCAPREAVVVADAFVVSLSPGIAPGVAEGCEGEGPPAGRLRGRVYDIPQETRLLPNFAALSPVATVCLDRLAVTPRRSVYPGFPGLNDRFRWFAVDLEGVFLVERPGVVLFRLISDDGAKIFIDGVLIIDNDGYHPPRMDHATVQLTAGRHRIRVPYWQGPGFIALMLDVARPGEPFHTFRVDQPLQGTP